LGSNDTSRRRSLPRAAVAALTTVALAASVAACGSGAVSNADEARGKYAVKVVEAKFPTSQRLGETSLLRLGIRNAGRRTIPALTILVSVAGEKGEGSSIPFGIRDPNPEIAQPDRPVWTLSAHYPKRDGSSKPGGTENANQKTFDFGPLKAGETTTATWKLSAVKAGAFTLLYGIDAGLGGRAKAVTAGGVKPGGSFRVRIASATPNTVVTDGGEVVELRKGAGKGK
jgi:hypothetical protein